MRKLLFIGFAFVLSLSSKAQTTFTIYNDTDYVFNSMLLSTFNRYFDPASPESRFPTFHTEQPIEIAPNQSYHMVFTGNVPSFPINSPSSVPFLDSWVWTRIIGGVYTTTTLNSINAMLNSATMGKAQVFDTLKFYLFDLSLPETKYQGSANYYTEASSIDGLDIRVDYTKNDLGNNFIQYIVHIYPN